MAERATRREKRVESERKRERRRAPSRPLVRPAIRFGSRGTSSRDTKSGWAGDQGDEERGASEVARDCARFG